MMFGDTHVHTIFSDGHNTPEEMVQAAAMCGMDYLVITDHARRGAGYVSQYVESLRQIGRQNHYLELKVGLEVKFLDLAGIIDCEDEWLDVLDWLVVSFHSFPSEYYKQYGAEVFKKVWFTALENFVFYKARIIKHVNPSIKIVVGHPFSLWKTLGLQPAPKDVLALVRMVAPFGVSLEINVNPKHFLGRDLVNLILHRCHDWVVGSDAHSVSELHALSVRISSVLELARREERGNKPCDGLWS